MFILLLLVVVVVNLGVCNGLLEQGPAPKMIQCLFCYQIYDPRQATGDLISPGISSAHCCLHEAPFQLVLVAIVRCTIQLPGSVCGR